MARGGVLVWVAAGIVLAVAGKPGLDKAIEAARTFLPAAQQPPAPMGRSAPLRVEIPDLKVKAKVTALGLNGDGSVRVPSAKETHLVSWYKHGPAPGETGAAALYGHVDSTTGPAVFYGVASLKEGRLIHVTRSDGERASFRVRSVETFPKKRFPTDRVYADTARPELRLITCGGAFDPARHEYADNVVVFADLAGEQP